MFIVTKIVNFLNHNAEEKYWHSEDVELSKQVTLPELTSEELLALRKTWPCFKFGEKDIILARLFKKENGFDPSYLVGSYHWVLMIKQINPHSQSVLW